MSEFGKTLFSGSKFIFWILTPCILIFLVTMTILIPILNPEWDFSFIAVIAGFWIVGILLILGMWNPSRFQQAFRIVTAMVFIAYLGSVLYALNEHSWKFVWPHSKGELNPVELLLGLAVIGIPSLIYAIFGRFTFRQEPDNDFVDRRVCGEFPEFCYKAFDCEEYAKQFIDSGKFHLNCLGYCRNMESKSRRDPTEGYGHTQEPGIVTVGLVSPNPAEKTIWTKEMGHQEHHIEMGNSLFCFCTCLPEVNCDYMKEGFGKYVVKINDPRKLAEDINKYFISRGQKFLIVGCRVVYNKGQKLDRELTKNERVDMSYKQKPESFSPDCEFRIVAIGEPCKEECKYLSGQFEQVEPECRFIEVNLGRQLNYLSLGF